MKHFGDVVQRCCRIGHELDGGASSVALGLLLQEGMGDTIRVSLTPHAPRPTPHASRLTPHAATGNPRTQEVASEILQALDLRVVVPSVATWPGMRGQVAIAVPH